MNQKNPTLLDVCKQIAGIREAIAFCGASAKFQKTLHSRQLALARLIAKEQGVSMKEAQKLSPDTKLGEKAQKEFAEFSSWAEKNSK
jgi:hypothetical protein